MVPAPLVSFSAALETPFGVPEEIGTPGAAFPQSQQRPVLEIRM
jgi:hypothetical protein